MIENDLNSVHLLALRTLSPKDNSKGKAMLKNLEENTTYSFCNGMRIENGRVYLPDLSSKLFDVTREQKTLRISVNAIVGENGSGKSTIIDYILRLINNLSAYILGEHYRAPGAEHLHFVYNVFVELYLTVSGRIVCVCCENDKISYIKYKHSIDNTHYIIDQQYGFSKDVNKAGIIDKHDDLRTILSSFCYTIVTNYSLYSLCAVNYEDDFTDYNKENRIRTIGINKGYDTKTIPTIREDAKKRQISMDDCYDAQCWLQGLFYKNDGYQCPLVINPMRKYGHIDIQKEYKLARERMTSLLFMRDENGKLQFNRINGKLIVESIEITKDIN